MELDRQIEAILFYKGEPVAKRELSRLFGVNMVAITDALKDLSQKLAGGGLALIERDSDVTLTTAPEAAELVEKFRKDELSRDLGKAALETLAIILYRGGTSRREIEYIRGVNSSSILRSLLIRGLVERGVSEEDERIFTYKPTVALQALLGLHSFRDLPEWGEVEAEFEAFEAEQKKGGERTQDDSGEEVGMIVSNNQQ